MQEGDMFCTDGYEQMATIDFVSGMGSVLVMHNNSTHILVAAAADSDPGGWATFEESFRYDEEIEQPYRKALERAIEIAMKR